MNVTEERRQGLATKATEIFGSEHGSTFMELVSPPPWEELATKADLAVTRAELRQEMSELRGEMAELRGELTGQVAKVDGKFAPLELRLERSIRTTIFAAMSIQTVVIGMLFGLFAALT